MHSVQWLSPLSSKRRSSRQLPERVKMLHLPKLNYECIHCGESCQMFEVQLDVGQVLEGSRDGKLYCLEGGCPHLGDSPQGRCLVYQRRPKVCQDFPFRVTETPGGRYVGASFACTAVSQGLGPDISGLDKDWSQYPALGHLQLELVPGWDCSWPTYQSLEEFVSDQLCFPHGPFLGALGVSLALAQRHTHWGQSQLKWLSDEVELVARRTLRGLLALCEAGDDLKLAEQVLVAQAQGGRYFSSLFGCWCEPERIHAEMQADQEAHWEVAEPFFRHLLFRKFLWGQPGVHARVCLLPLIGEMIHFWSWVPAMAALGKPTVEHRRKAIREVERRLTFHSTGWEDYLRPLSAAFLEGVA